MQQQTFRFNPALSLALDKAQERLGGLEEKLQPELAATAELILSRHVVERRSNGLEPPVEIYGLHVADSDGKYLLTVAVSYPDGMSFEKQYEVDKETGDIRLQVFNARDTEGWMCCAPLKQVFTGYRKLDNQPYELPAPSI